MRTLKKERGKGMKGVRMGIKCKTIGLTLLMSGLSLSYTQPRYNVIKDPSFEADSEIWKEIAHPEDAASADRHFYHLTAPDQEHVGVIFAGTGGKGTEEDPYHSGKAALLQEFIPRIVSDFDLDNSLELWMKWKPMVDTIGPYEWGIRILSIQGDTLNFKNPSRQDTWIHIQYGNIYEEWINKGLSGKDSVYKIELWATSQIKLDSIWHGGYPGWWEIVYGCMGEVVSWDIVSFYSKRPDLDAGVLSIDSPDRREEGYEPISTVKNFGAALISFPFICDIRENEKLIYSNTVWVDDLKPDSTIQITFKKYTGACVPTEAYSIKCYTLLNDDQNPGNNSLAKDLMTGILEKEETEITPIIPTIFIGEMTLHLPKGGRVTLYSINGRVVKELCDRDGNGKVVFGKDLAPGVYFLITPKGKEKLIKIK